VLFICRELVALVKRIGFHPDALAMSDLADVELVRGCISSLMLVNKRVVLRAGVSPTHRVSSQGVVVGTSPGAGYAACAHGL
jgi:hypothetical protein